MAENNPPQWDTINGHLPLPDAIACTIAPVFGHLLDQKSSHSQGGNR